ncbi:MAG: type II/IV secretion system protein [Candidatus Taylorbacteria bacterium]|nr:type II/IV secretion system protein [Candidatus Taylorbacteria bacterium]
MVQFDEDKQKHKLAELLKKEEEDLVQLLGAKYSLDYVDLSTVAVNTDALRLIDEKDSREARIVAYAIFDKKLKVAARQPGDEKTVAVIKSLEEKGFEVNVNVASTASLEKGWNAYKDLSFAYETKAGSLEISNDEIAKIVDQVTGLPQVQEILTDIFTQKKSYRISRILETILAGALATGASDVHIEPEEEYIRIRYRLDGVLQDVLRFDTSTYTLLLSRIKLLSGLKLNIKKDSQDGRFSVHLKDTDIEIRTSILPGAYNESVVLRILNPKSISVPLEELGIHDKLLATILRQIDKPNGMLLTTGPTGSGKTTTLYALLKKVHAPAIKIITIEDPIEYHLPGIVQTQVNDQGYTFLEGLRSALRQDPDIIMVGEIRDSETAAIAINSALTGHLVFSTLHTNNAAGSFPRLLDLGINSRVISSAITIALAQRLVRKLCPVCRKESTLTGPVLEKVEKVLNAITDKNEIPTEHTKVWEAVGCDKCNKTGYKGRVGVYEGILIDEAVNNLIETGSSEKLIRDAARPQGLLTMPQDGVLKVLKGITTLDELERVIDITEY